MIKKEGLKMQNEIYLDNAATTPVHSTVIKAMVDCMVNDYGNSSSLHRLGLRAEKRVKEAREQLASVMKVKSDEIFFTSGGTESNNLAILGTVMDRRRDGKHCITTKIEHPSVLNVFKYLEKEGWDITYLPVNEYGMLDLEDVVQALRSDTVLVSIMHVNNEIGSIQPVQAIGEILRSHENSPYFHVDAIQSLGKLDVSPEKWWADLVSISGHKIHGPKGIGSLYIRKGIKIQPLQWGGGQERGVRSGTENIPGIVGLGQAVQRIEENLKKEQLYHLKGMLAGGLLECVPAATINGPKLSEGAPHILNVSFPNIKGEVMLHALEARGVFVSTGSACSSRSGRISHVFAAIGASKQTAQGAIRISLSYMNTEDEMGKAVEIISQCVKELEGFVRR
jgi:cysteine desulfurase